MKKQFAILAFIGFLLCGAVAVFAQDSTAAAPPATEAAVTETPADAPVEEASFHQVLKEKFIEGGVPFMWPILICMILGLAVSIERIITLNLATTNTKKLLTQIEDALAKGGVEATISGSSTSDRIRLSSERSRTASWKCQP